MGSLIITTVGTSIFENFLQKFGVNDDVFSEPYNELKKASTAYACWQERAECDIRPIRDRLEKKKYYQYEDLSAEVASILSIQKELKEEVNVHLLATDTILSVLAAELIKDWFGYEENKGKYPGISAIYFDRPVPTFEKQSDSVFVIRKLRIDQQSDFEEGMMNLLQVLNSISTSESILNITGGYKGIVPIVTIWAQIKKVSLKYLFRENELDKKIQPLTLERLPIHFDWEFIETIAFALNEDVRKNLKKDHQQDKKILELLTKNQLIKEDRGLTALGDIFQQYLNQDGQPTANSILGLFVEYKLFEFFSTNKYHGIKYQPTKVSIYKNPDGTLTNQKHENNQTQGYCEIDLFLTGTDGASIIAESKAYNQTGDRTIEELSAKARKYVEFNPRRPPVELWLIVVSASMKTSVGEWYNNSNDPKFKVIQNGKAKLGTPFRVFSYQFDLSTGKLSQGIAAINTKSLLQNPIQEHELIEINFSNG